MKNRNLTLFYISQSLAFTYFWLVIAIPYLLYRGMSPIQAFSLMSVYQLFGVFLEYPTGVIGDKYGYRAVTYLSNFLNLIAMLIMLLPGGYFLYLFGLLILSLGNSFSSGNDMGILKSVSRNIKKDTANYNSLMDFVFFLSSVIGGFLGKISYELALVVSGICMFSANLPLYFIKTDAPQNKNPNSLISIIKDSFKSLVNPTVKQLFIIVALFGGYSFTIKSIFGSFGTVYHLDVAVIGIIIGLGGLTRSIGGKLYAEFPKSNIVGLTILIGLSIILMGIFPGYYSVVSLMLLNQLFFGYLLSKIDGDIHDLASDHVRASLFSLKRLVMRLVASGYLALYGFAIGINQFTLMVYGTGVALILGVILAWQYLTQRSAR